MTQRACWPISIAGTWTKVALRDVTCLVRPCPPWLVSGLVSTLLLHTVSGFWVVHLCADLPVMAEWVGETPHTPPVLLGDGRWAATITLGYEGSKRKRKTFYGETRREVQEQLTKALADIQKGLPLANERITVEQYLERWLAESAPMALRLSTAQSYAYLIRSYILPDLGRIMLARLAPQDVQQLLTRKLASGLSPRTVQYIHAVLRRTLNQAIKWGLVTRNVATMIDAPRVDRPEAEPLTPEEARAFLASVHGDRLEVLYTVAFAMGLRRGEALAFRWEDLDWDKRTLRVRRTVGRVDHELRLSEPKSRQSRRTIMLPEIALAALRAPSRTTSRGAEKTR